MNEIEKAERIQAWKAFLIPTGLFIACLLNAAGIYILYSGNAIGMVFLGLGLAIIIGGIFAFITFQNEHRANGNWKVVSDDLPEHLIEAEDVENNEEQIETVETVETVEVVEAVVEAPRTTVGIR